MEGRVGRCRVLLIAATIAVLAGALGGGGEPAPAVGAAGPPQGLELLGAERTDDGRRLRAELQELRTRTSRTYVDESGLRVVRIFPGSVNHRSSDGRWLPNDNRLVTDSRGGYRNAAGDYSVQLPPALDRGPVRVERGDVWMSFGLRVRRVSVRWLGVGSRIGQRCLASMSSTRLEMTGSRKISC